MWRWILLRLCYVTLCNLRCSHFSLFHSFLPPDSHVIRMTNGTSGDEHTKGCRKTSCETRCDVRMCFVMKGSNLNYAKEWTSDGTWYKLKEGRRRGGGEAMMTQESDLFMMKMTMKRVEGAWKGSDEADKTCLDRDPDVKRQQEEEESYISGNLSLPLSISLFPSV